MCNPQSRYKSLNQDYAFCFSLSLMTNFSRSHIGCRDSSQFSISALCKCGYPSNVSCNKFCDIAKITSMAINGIPLGYVNNYDKNRYLERFSKAAVNTKGEDRTKIDIKENNNHNRTFALLPVIGVSSWAGFRRGGGITYFVYRLFVRGCQIKCATIHDVKSKNGSNDQELVQSEPNPIILCSKPKWELTKLTKRHSTKRIYGLSRDQLFPKMWPLSYLTLAKYHLDRYTGENSTEADTKTSNTENAIICTALEQSVI